MSYQVRILYVHFTHRGGREAGSVHNFYLDFPIHISIFEFRTGNTRYSFFLRVRAHESDSMPLIVRNAQRPDADEPTVGVLHTVH